MESPQSNVASLPGVAASARGRVNPDQQEAVIKMSVVKECVGELERLYTKKQEASEDFNTAVKSIAEKAGINSGPLKKFVVARCKEKIPEVTRDQEQLALLLFDVGE